MSISRDTPYSAFNFQVELEPGKGGETNAGFSEVSGLNIELTVAEYRAGNSPTNYVKKVPGIHKAGDVTMKRGVIGAANLYAWIEAVRQGFVLEDTDQGAIKKDILVKLYNETRSAAVVTWKLRGAMPLKWTGPSLAAKGGADLAIEELVLSVETIEQI